MFYYLNPSIVVYSIMVIFNAMCMYEEYVIHITCSKKVNARACAIEIEIEIEKGVGDRGIF